MKTSICHLNSDARFVWVGTVGIYFNLYSRSCHPVVNICKTKTAFNQNVLKQIAEALQFLFSENVNIFLLNL